MGDLLSGMDLCFNPNNLGPQDDEGHYLLSYGLIQRSSTSMTWTKVVGFQEQVAKNTDFLITLYDLSNTVTSIDFVNIAWRPSADTPSRSQVDSPFNPSDFDDMLDGKQLTTSGQGMSTGCAATANAFTYGQYTLKNSGPFEVTIEVRITVNGQSLQFKCDPKIIVGAG